MTAGDKIGTGLGSILLGAIMAASGFNGALKVQPPAVSTASAWVFIWSQAVLSLLIVLILFFLGLDEASTDLTIEHPDDKK